MGIKFYNAGGNINEKMAWDNPVALTDSKNQNCIAYFDLVVKPACYFEVPTEITLIVNEQEMPVPVRFADRIIQAHGPHGVVRIDPKYKGSVDTDDYVAANEKDAKIKAERIWEQAMYRLVREHQEQCARVRNNGFRPNRATGTVAYALRTLKIEDPANDVEDVVKRQRDDSELEALKKQVAELTAAMLTKKA